MKGYPFTLACVVLTKNEEINVERCLRSLGWCDECVIVDSGSTDRTAAVGRAAGARVEVNVQKGAFNIAEQRNWALTRAGISADWVLFLDADEEVTPELRDALLAELQRNADGCNAYELTPKYLFWGRWLKRTQGYPNWHPRLVRRTEAGFTGGVWEHFDARARIGRIQEPYNHFANSKGLSDWLARHDRYSTWDAQKIVDFLASGDAAALGTTRKARLRLWAARLYPLRPFVRFAHTYLIRRGFLEGFPAFMFCTLYFFYEWMTVVKVIELKRQRRGQPL
jgi:glycosyltransferase involved in cell wall biosynthesis